LGQRIEKIIRDGEFALEESNGPLPGFFRDRNQAHHWLLATCDDNFLATFGFLDQKREIGLGLINSEN
jgi:hypothetical protein